MANTSAKRSRSIRALSKRDKKFTQHQQHGLSIPPVTSSLTPPDPNLIRSLHIEIHREGHQLSMMMIGGFDLPKLKKVKADQDQFRPVGFRPEITDSPALSCPPEPRWPSEPPTQLSRPQRPLLDGEKIEIDGVTYTHRPATDGHGRAPMQTLHRAAPKPITQLTSKYNMLYQIIKKA